MAGPEEVLVAMTALAAVVADMAVTEAPVAQIPAAAAGGSLGTVEMEMKAAAEGAASLPMVETAAIWRPSPPTAHNPEAVEAEDQITPMTVMPVAATAELAAALSST